MTKRLLEKLRFEQAVPDDAAEIARLRTRVADDLTARYGLGHWSAKVGERGVLHDMSTSRVIIVRRGSAIVGTLRLATKKPWAIDVTYFTPRRRPIYLTDMAVDPPMQGRGIGRRLLEEARRIVTEWPGDAIRLDAYDAEAGAGGFYSSCGYREVGRVSYKGTPLIYFELLI